jgi:hypothetical protein
MRKINKIKIRNESSNENKSENYYNKNPRGKGREEISHHLLCTRHHLQFPTFSYAALAQYLSHISLPSFITTYAINEHSTISCFIFSMLLFYPYLCGSDFTSSV